MEARDHAGRIQRESREDDDARQRRPDECDAGERELFGQQKPNLYRWQRVGNKLILHANAEPNRDRKAVLVGSWVKRGG